MLKHDNNVSFLFDADYGNSFSDVIQGLEHILENLGSEPNSAPSSFKYRVALEKQVKNLNNQHLDRNMKFLIWSSLSDIN